MDIRAADGRSQHANEHVVDEQENDQRGDGHAGSAHRSGDGAGAEAAEGPDPEALKKEVADLGLESEGLEIEVVGDDHLRERGQLAAVDLVAELLLRLASDLPQPGALAAHQPDDPSLRFLIGVIDEHVHQEPVHLGLGQRVGAP